MVLKNIEYRKKCICAKWMTIKWAMSISKREAMLVKKKRGDGVTEREA